MKGAHKSLALCIDDENVANAREDNNLSERTPDVPRHQVECPWGGMDDRVGDRGNTECVRRPCVNVPRERFDVSVSGPTAGADTRSSHTLWDSKDDWHKSVHALTSTPVEWPPSKIVWRCKGGPVR